jgi:hypothetical protein
VGATQRDPEPSPQRAVKTATVQLTVRIASDLKRSLDLSVARINGTLLAEGYDAISHRDIIEAVLAPALHDFDERADESDLMQRIRQRAESL